MALQVVRTYDEQVAGTTVLSALRKHVEADGSAVLLVPTFSAQLDASRSLARAGLSLGVRVTTPSAWTQERWEVWGDGSHIVSPVERTVAMQRTLKHACEHPGATLEYNPGTVRVLENLARQVLPVLEGLYNKGPHHESVDFGADSLGQNGWNRMREDLAQNCGLTQGELGALDLVRAYANDIHSAGFVEECEAMVRIPELLTQLGVNTPGVVASVRGALSRRVRDLLCGLAATTQVTIAFGLGNPQVTASAERSVRELKDAAVACGVQVSDAVVPAEASTRGNVTPAEVPVQKGSGSESAAGSASEPLAGGNRSRELAELFSSIFGGGESPVMQAQGSLGVLAPAGPKAEAECVARALNSLVNEGAKSIVVSAPNAERAWRELAPKLASRGIGVKAQFSLPATSTIPGRAFIEYAQCVARLCSLANSWPAEQPCDEGRLVVLGDDMSWWPPSDLVDFLMSDLSGMSAQKAMRLDRSWRSNRLLTPEAVLKALLNPKDTSARVAQATRELMRGRLASAASKLLSPLVANDGVARNSQNSGACNVATPSDDTAASMPVVGDIARDALARAQAQGVLTAVMDVAKALREIGEYQEAKGVTGEVGNTYPHLEELVTLAADGLSCASVVVRPKIPGDAVGDAAAQGGTWVEIVPPSVASTHAALSADAVVLCGLTSVESGVPNGDDVATALVEALGVEPPVDAVAQVRESFGAQLAVARSRVMLERTLWNAQSKDCYPSVMLTEVLACYGIPGNVEPKDVAGALQAKHLLAGQRSEEDAFANLEATGSVPAVACKVGAHPADVLDPELLPYVVVPANGKPELVDGKPMLSPTQIETYLDCPYKWFSLRRLNLGDSDAGFSGAEMGEFVHHVLEVTHRELVSQAAESAGTTLEEVQANPSLHLRGCRVDALDSASLERARSVLSAEFDAHRKRQFLRKQRQRSVPLIPHDAQDLGQMDAMKKDLLSVLDYESCMFVGYEPRMFEKRFGYDGALVEYAGAYINGTIDRVDVDAHGHALVIDYKHKSPNAFTNQYDSLPANMGEPGALDDWVPRHVQTLMYAQYLRKCYPELTVTGAVYLCTKHGHAVAGAVDEGSIDNVFGEHGPSKQRMPQVAVPAGESFGQQNKRGMEALLDATEQIVAQKVAELMAGNIEANPRDPSSCDYCPVKNCKKRMGK